MRSIDVDNTKKPGLLSLCTGYGGIERGLEIAGVEFRTVAHVEIEAWAVANLVDKMEAGKMVPAPVWTDLKTFPVERFRGMVDILTGGFPCQPFSAAGRQKADSDPRHLFPYISRIIEVLKPGIVFLENVDGIASARLSGNDWSDPAGTPVLLHVLRELERMGYTATAGLYTAAEMGAPHLRKRWFIMAKSEGFRINGWGLKFREAQSGGMGNAKRKGLEGNAGDGQNKGSGKTSNRPTCPPSICWPLPPGPDQWEWEETRTI